MQSVGIAPSYFETHIYERCKRLWAQENQCIPISDIAYITTTWSTGIMLNQFIDTPMHLLFQGIVKSVTEFSFALLARYYKKINVQKKIISNDEYHESIAMRVLSY